MVALVTALLGFGDLPSSPALSPAICATWIPVVSTVYFAAESTAVGRELLPAVRIYGPSTQLDQLLTMPAADNDMDFLYISLEQPSRAVQHLVVSSLHRQIPAPSFVFSPSLSGYRCAIAHKFEILSPKYQAKIRYFGAPKHACDVVHSCIGHRQ